MSFKNDIRALTAASLTALKEVNNSIAQLEKDKAGYYGPTYEATMRELVAKRTEIQANALDRAGELAEEYKKTVSRKFAPKGGELTEDVHLLTSGLSLTGPELNDLFDKHKGNNTMQRLITEYATKNNTPNYARVPETEQTYNEAAALMVNYTKSALSRPDFSDLMLSDEYFDQITPDCMKED